MSFQPASEKKNLVLLAQTPNWVRKMLQSGDSASYLVTKQFLVFILGAVAIEYFCHDRSEAVRLLGPFNRHPFECGMLITATSTCISLCWLIVVQGKKRKRMAMSTAFISSISCFTNVVLHQGYSPVVVNYFGRYLFPLRVIGWATTLPIIAHVSGEISTVPRWQVGIYEQMGPLCMVLGLMGIWTKSPLVVIFCTSLAFMFYIILLYGFWEMFDTRRSKLKDASSKYIQRLFTCYTFVNFMAFPTIWMAGALSLISMDAESYGLVFCDAMFKAVFASFLLGGAFVRVESESAAKIMAIGVGEKEALVDELRKSLSKESHFVASISHELRTPLNGIIGLSENIIEGVYGVLNDDVKKVVSTIKKSGARLQCLVNDLLDFAAIKTGKLVIKREEVNMREIVEHVIDLTIPLVKWNVKIVNKIAEDFPLMEGDPERLTAVFHNLLGNAAKFTEKGSISVSARLLNRTSLPPTVQVVVEDTGIGIPQDKLEQIFTEFEQVDSSTTRKYGGTGLGLSLVEKLIHAHNGSIAVESIMGRGSTFTIDLPMIQPDDDTPPSPPQLIQLAANKRAPDMHAGLPSSPPSKNTSAPTTPSPSTSPSSFHPEQRMRFGSSVFAKLPSMRKSPNHVNPPSIASTPKEAKAQHLPPMVDMKGRGVFTHGEVRGQIEILSVDDDHVNQMVLEGILKKGGYKVTKKLDGMTALEYFDSANEIPDLVLLDVMMPGISGFEVCKKLRERFPPSFLPIIMVSARSQEADIVEGFKCGSNDYITKPFRRFEVLARIEMQLTLKSLWRNQVELEKSEELLRQMLPVHIIDRLRQGQRLIADCLPDVTIVFSDIVGFTNIAASNKTADIVAMLNAMFTAFDDLTDQYGVYKVETIGDAYMAVAGHDGSPGHAECAINMAKGMVEVVKALDLPASFKDQIKIRIGVHSGPAYGGVVGAKCPRFCLFGDTVNMASRMESSGFPMAIHTSQETYNRLSHSHEFVSLGPRFIKGKGINTTYLLKYGEHEEAVRLHRSTLESESGWPSSTEVAQAGSESFEVASSPLFIEGVEGLRGASVDMVTSSLHRLSDCIREGISCRPTEEDGGTEGPSRVDVEKRDEIKDVFIKSTSCASPTDGFMENDNQSDDDQSDCVSRDNGVECLRHTVPDIHESSPVAPQNLPHQSTQFSQEQDATYTCSRLASVRGPHGTTKGNEDGLPLGKYASARGEEDKLQKPKPKAGRLKPGGDCVARLVEGEGRNKPQDKAVTNATHVGADERASSQKDLEQVGPKLGGNLNQRDGHSPLTRPRKIPEQSPRGHESRSSSLQARKLGLYASLTVETEGIPSSTFENPLFGDEWPRDTTCVPAKPLVTAVQPQHSTVDASAPAESVPRSAASGGAVGKISPRDRFLTECKPSQGKIGQKQAPIPDLRRREHQVKSLTRLLLDDSDCGTSKTRMPSPDLEARKQKERRKLHSFLAPLELEHYVPRLLKEEITTKMLEQLSIVELQSLTFLSKGAMLRIYRELHEDTSSLD